MEGLYLAMGAGVLALLFAVFLGRRVLVIEEGTPLMQEIGAAIQEGSNAFLKREYTVLAFFVIVIAGILLALGLARDEQEPSVAYAYLVGAISSALAGFIGMRIAVKANMRTAAAARTSLNKALRVAFSSGGVMGITVVGIGILGATILWIVFEDPAIVAGFSFGASSIALFARVGGGIYTKAADVGGDLAGKVEAGIPEDDARNAAVIADNVGDNVGDVAGMGADLFESYVGSIIATLALATTAAFYGRGDCQRRPRLRVALPDRGRGHRRVDPWHVHRAHRRENQHRQSPLGAEAGHLRGRDSGSGRLHSALSGGCWSRRTASAWTRC